MILVRTRVFGDRYENRIEIECCRVENVKVDESSDNKIQNENTRVNYISINSRQNKEIELQYQSYMKQAKKPKNYSILINQSK